MSLIGTRAPGQMPGTGPDARPRGEGRESAALRTALGRLRSDRPRAGLPKRLSRSCHGPIVRRASGQPDQTAPWRPQDGASRWCNTAMPQHGSRNDRVIRPCRAGRIARHHRPGRTPTGPAGRQTSGKDPRRNGASGLLRVSLDGSSKTVGRNHPAPGRARPGKSRSADQVQSLADTGKTGPARAGPGAFRQGFSGRFPSGGPLSGGPPSACGHGGNGLRPPPAPCHRQPCTTRRCACERPDRKSC